jgi:hypothetical protein
MVITGYFGAAATADPPPAGSDPASLGGLSLFNPAGAPITSGSDGADWARFAVAGNAGPQATAPVVLSAAVVDASEPPDAWPVTILVGGPGATPATATPDGLPAALLPLAGSVLDTGDSRLADALSTTPSTATDDETSDLLVQLRLRASTRADEQYWATYVDIDPTTGRWRLASDDGTPAVPTLRVPQVTQDIAGVISVAGTVAPAADGTRPTGWVELFAGDTDRGAAAYDPATGALRARDLPNGARSDYHFEFTPADPADYGSADSPSLVCTCGTRAGTPDPTATQSPGPGQPQPTMVIVTVTPPKRAAAYGNTTIAISVLPADAPGTVALTDGSRFAATVPVANGRATLTSNSLGAGRHVISATFTPTDPNYSPASATSAPFRLVASAGPSQTGSVSATVGAGPLTITTPYGPGHPLELGSLALAPDGSRLVATAHIGSAADAAHGGITITDTRAGDPGWSASLLASDLTNGADTISAQNLGFVAVHPVSVPGYGGGGLGRADRPVATHDIEPATLVEAPGAADTGGLAGTPKVFASATHGRGSVYIYGDLQVQAPTSALSGEYTATLTFTVS